MTQRSLAWGTAPIPERRGPCGGFTLIEIMVVVVILGLLAALVVPNVVESADHAREQTARTNAVTIARAVQGYRVRNCVLPASLSALAERDAKGLRELDELPRDPWDNEFVLWETEGDPGWEIVSVGPDGVEGTEDDVSSRSPG